jgi:hypothetical protein
MDTRCQKSSDGNYETGSGKESCYHLASSGSCSLFQGFHFPFDPLDKSDFRRFKIISGLKVHPALGVSAEETGETQGGISGDGPISGTDFIDAALEHTNGFD